MDTHCTTYCLQVRMSCRQYAYTLYYYFVYSLCTPACTLVCCHKNMKFHHMELVTARFTPYRQSCPQTPTQEERIWWHPADPLGFINVDYFLETNFPPSNHTAENTICDCNTRKSPLSMMTQHFFGTQISYQFSTMHTASYECLMKPKEISQMSPDPLHAGGVWVQDYLYR